MRRTTLGASLALVAALLPLASGAAVPVWQPITDLSSPSGSASRVDVAVTPTGTSIAAWTSFDGPADVVQASVRPPGGAWSPPVDLSPAWTGTTVSAPDVAVDEAGNASVIWTWFGRNGGSTGYVQVATWTDRAWTATTTVTSTAEDHGGPLISLDPAGSATGLWIGKLGPEYLVRSAAAPAGGGWEGETDLAVIPDYARQMYPPQLGGLVTDRSGNVTAVWMAYDSMRYTVQSATRPADGPWTTPVELSAPGDAGGFPRLAVGRDGTVLAVWTAGEGPAATTISVAELPPGGSWSAPVMVSDGAGNAGYPHVAVDPSGTATVVWNQDGLVRSASRTRGGEWSDPVDISSPGTNAYAPEVTLGPGRTATAVWTALDDLGATIRSATRDDTGAWAESVDLAHAYSFGPTLAADRAGNVTVAWSRIEGGRDVVQARGLDAAGPDVVVTSPSSGAVGQQLSWSVAVVDAWSPLADVRWDFGDGVTASGASVTHAYSAPGAQRATVTVTDGAGQTSVRTVGVLITPAPVTPTGAQPASPPPTIAAFTIRPTTIRAAGSASRRPSRTRATLVLDAPATVTLRFTGRRTATLSRTLDAGRSTIRFAARVDGTRLRPGTYRVTARASNAQGTGAPRFARLTVVR